MAHDATLMAADGTLTAADGSLGDGGDSGRLGWRDIAMESSRWGKADGGAVAGNSRASYQPDAPASDSLGPGIRLGPHGSPGSA